MNLPQFVMDGYEEEAIANIIEDDGSLRKRLTRYTERIAYSWDLKSRVKVKYAFCGAIPTCIFFLLVIVVLFPLCVEYNYHPHYETPEQNDLIKFSREYQITLDVSPITNRSEFVNSWIKEWNSASKYIQLETEDVEVATRTQFYLDTTQCDKDHEFRVRYFNSGDVAASVDVKSSETRKSTCNNPFWPRDDFVDNSTQKCELDTHDSGYQKYSRITKIHLDEHRPFNTCADLATYFPWEFADLRPYQWYLPVTINEHRQVQYWWSGEIGGKEQGVKYKLESSLRYQTEEMREDETTPSLGELSIRIFANHGGHSEEWNDDIVYDVENAWQTLVQSFSKHSN